MNQHASMRPPNPSLDVNSVVSKPLFQVYDELLVPLIFEPYAGDVVRRLTDVDAGSILEVAAGTGAVTRSLAASLPAEVSITATDLVPAMIDEAMRLGTARPVTWKQANALALPFENGSFDVIVCQFGAMFFEPKPDAFAEVHRVLRPGGRLLFSVWDALDDNEYAATVASAVRNTFPENPPTFLERTPYGYHDRDAIVADLRAGGFGRPPSIDRVGYRSRAETPVHVAAAFCAGTPLRDEIERRGPESLAEGIGVATAALAQRFGPSDLEGRISAQVVTAIRS